MTDEVRLSALLARWQELQRQGLKPDVNEVCRENPELADELRRRIGDATQLSQQADTASSSPRAGSSEDPVLAPPQGPGEIGRLGEFKLVREIGKGGMGVVYEGEDTNLNRRVAVKVLRPNLADEQFRKRFVREARAVASLKDPHVVTVFQVGQQGETPFMVMEYLEGESLEYRLQRQPIIPLMESVRIASEVANGLAAAHANQLVHRDVKPGNIWLESPNGRVKLLDFGLVRPQSEVGQQLTAHGAIAGTIGYMAPEQIYGGPLDARTDLYALGCVLYRMLWGGLPHDAADTITMLEQVVTQEPANLNAVARSLPVPVALLLRRLLARNPDDRPASAREVAAELRSIQGDLSGAVKPAPTTTMFEKHGLKKSTLGVWIGGATVLLAIIIGLATQYHRIFHRTAVNPEVAANPPDSPSAPVFTGEPIRIGILHSMNGTFKDSEKPMFEAIVLAVEEINANGGVLGREVKWVPRDPASDENESVRLAEVLIVEEKVEVIFGCWSSASRKKVAEVCAKHNQLLVYSCLGEGLEEHPNVVYVGGAPNQQLAAAAKWAYTEAKKRKYFLVGSNCVYSNCSHAILTDALNELGGKIVGDRLEPLEAPDFRPVATEIAEQKADIIFNTIDGNSNIAFAQALQRAGLTPDKVPSVWLGIGEDELGVLNFKRIVGDYAVTPYFESLDTPENRAFVERFKKRHSARQRISDSTEAAYCAVYLWKQAVEKANSTEPLSVRDGFRGQAFDGPEGRIMIDKNNLYAWRRVRVGQMTNKLTFEIVYATEPLEPLPFPATRTRAAWDLFLKDLRTSLEGKK